MYASKIQAISLHGYLFQLIKTEDLMHFNGTTTRDSFIKDRNSNLIADLAKIVQSVILK